MLFRCRLESNLEFRGEGGYCSELIANVSLDAVGDAVGKEDVRCISTFNQWIVSATLPLPAAKLRVPRVADI
jgi:hypothetical protein